MFRPTGVFGELMCPDASCDRPYCQFWHEPAQNPSINIVQSNSSADVTEYSGYSASVESVICQIPESFSGYSASVADLPRSPMSIYAPNSPNGLVHTMTESYDLPSSSFTYTPTPINPISTVSRASNFQLGYVPTPIARPTPPAVESIPVFSLSNVKREVCDDDEVMVVREKIVNPKESKTSKDATKAVESAKTIASETVALIDKQIEQLMKLREQAVTTTETLSSSKSIDLSKVKVEKDSYPIVEVFNQPIVCVPKKKNGHGYEPAVPVKHNLKTNLSGYTPTPLADLLKRKTEKRIKQEAESFKRKLESSNAKRSFSVDELFGDDDEPEEKIRKSEKIADLPLKALEVTKPTKQVNKSAPSINKTVPDGVEKGKGLTNGQIEAARARLARPGATTVIRPVAKIGNARKIPTAAEQMLSRFKVKAAETTSNESSSKGGHVTQEKLYGHRLATSASTSSKGEKRTARQVINNSLKPVLIEPTNGKIPMFVRSKMIERIYKELLSFLPQEDALEQAPIEEKSVMDKVSSKNAYVVAIPNAIKRLRDVHSGKSSSGNIHGISHSRVLAGKAHDQITVKASGPKKAVEITEERLYKAFEENYLLTEEQMCKNSYPRFVDNNRVFIEPSPYDKKRNKKTFVADYVMERICSRCSAEYTLCPRGTFQKAECTFHLKSKARLPGKPRNNESIFPCCGGDASVVGCQAAPTHVSDTLRDSELESFRTAPSPISDDPRSKKVYALDCEMVYTVWGPALARLTVVNTNEEVVLDEIVKPTHLIIDYNTVFSGITANELETATYSLKKVQDSFFDLVNSETILVGHSLESDLKALRIVHSRVVDTAILYPHRIDNEKKRGLKEIVFDKLKKIIQEDVGGHDSKEDSVSALQLAIYKAKFDGKV